MMAQSSHTFAFRRMWIFLWFFIVRSSNSQNPTTQGVTLCTRDVNQTLTCPPDAIIEKFDFDNLTAIDKIETLRIIGSNDNHGLLTSIPENICLLTGLKHLDLRFNRIRNASFAFSHPCLSKLEVLDLSNNYLTEVPTDWISQMPKLKQIILRQNQLNDIPYRMFHNISNIEHFDVASNNLETFELWLIQIKHSINYQYNPLSRFTNNHRVDLSKYQSNITAVINLTTFVLIDFDDGIFEMFNRCDETTSMHNLILKQAFAIMDDLNPGLLKWKCSCEQYYLQEYVVSRKHDFSTWRCPDAPHIIYSEMCSLKSSFNTTNVQPRLCTVNQLKRCTTSENSDLGFCYLKSLSNISTLEEISSIIENKFNQIALLNNISAHPFAGIIDESNRILQSNIHLTITESVRTNFQLIISHIEDLITHIRNPLEFILGSVAILSVNKSSSINSFSQIRQNETSFIYSNETNSTTTITIDQQSIDSLSSTDIYTFYYLPISLFQYAQEEQNIIIIPPIVGVYLLNNSSRLIKISFTDISRSFGRYSCVFWQYNQWNDSGCTHSMDLNLNRHYCSCNHTTSFALIFIPNKTIDQTYIPSITIAIISIVCFCISIILSIHRQAASFRALSITNIFNLINSIILFILLTIILFKGYRSNDKMNNHCSKNQENLVITTYFFLISTFASKTFLGISYFLTIFFHFIFIQFAAISNRWFYSGFFLVILIALIPTIIISSILKQWKDLFLQYQGICWLNSSVIFQFVSIPIIIFIGLNVLIIIGITIRLLKFSYRQKAVKTNEKRLIVSMMIWLALCVTLGIGWIFGPFLDIFIQDKEQTSSKIKLWFFGIFIGLEGVWVLMVNGIFYVNQRVNKNNRRMFLNKNKN